MTQLEEFREVIASQGLRIGALEPTLRLVQALEEPLDEVIQELRSLKLYEQSDKLREIHARMKAATSYIFER